MKTLLSILVLIALIFGGYLLWKEKTPEPIGGERDQYGCLTSAGYGWDEEVGACIRAFEMTPDIKQASRIAVDPVRGAYALTVVSFNSYEEEGSYDIVLERDVERNRETVFIRDWQAVEPKTVRLFYYNPEQDRDAEGNIQCSRDGLVTVERQIPPSETVIKDTIELLLKGNLTEEERQSGITTEYPLSGFSLKNSMLQNGALTLEFDDSENKAVGGACRVGILWFQIEETAKQFSEVKTVRFLPEEIFQP